MIDLCSDSEESCTVQDVRPENDSNPSRKKQKRIERKHQDDLFKAGLLQGMSILDLVEYPLWELHRRLHLL